MFYCKPCGEEKGWPNGLVRSDGNCEICGKHADCSDVPSSHLPDCKVSTIDDVIAEKQEPTMFFCQGCGETTACAQYGFCESCAAEDKEPDKSTVMNVISDMVANLLYYNRKGDEDLPVGAIEKMIKDGKLTTDEIVARFKAVLEKGI
jgi:hypothetical protein